MTTKDYKEKNACVLRCIFNVDEKRIFYMMQPSKCPYFWGVKCTDGKYYKARLSVLVGASDDYEKPLLLVISKSKILWRHRKLLGEIRSKYQSVDNKKHQYKICSWAR